MSTDSLIGWSMRQVLKIVLALVVFSLILGGISWAVGWITLPARVVNPQAAVYNWQWYYDTHASLQAQADTVRQYEERLANFEKDYGEPATWDWQTREERQRLASVVDGYVANYNRVASEYNASMRDITRRWAKPPDLPACIANWGSEHCTYTTKYEVH